jgi:competence protein ComEC
MGRGIEAMSWVGGKVAALPGAVALVPSIPTIAVAFMVVGGLWLCLWGARWRLLGLVPILVGLALAPMTTTPDVLIGAGGSLVAVRGSDGRLAVLGGRRARFELERWLEHDADPRPPGDVGVGGVILCDQIGCQAETAGARLAIARHPAALGDDCVRADLVIWLGEGSPSCGNAHGPRVIPRETIARLGTHVVFVERHAAGTAAAGPHGSGVAGSDGRATTERPTFRIRSVAEWRGSRPWAAPHDGRDQTQWLHAAGRR